MPPSTPRAPWSVGFALADITPPLGTHLFGFGGRDRGPGCTAIHDPLQVRAVWIGAGREATLILGFDLLFFDRGEADRIKGMNFALQCTLKRMMHHQYIEQKNRK